MINTYNYKLSTNVSKSILQLLWSMSKKMYFFYSYMTLLIKTMGCFLENEQWTGSHFDSLPTGALHLETWSIELDWLMHTNNFSKVINKFPEKQANIAAILKKYFQPLIFYIDSHDTYVLIKFNEMKLLQLQHSWGGTIFLKECTNIMKKKSKVHFQMHHTTCWWMQNVKEWQKSIFTHTSGSALLHTRQ